MDPDIAELTPDTRVFVVFQNLRKNQNFEMDLAIQRAWGLFLKNPPENFQNENCNKSGRKLFKF